MPWEPPRSADQGRGWVGGVIATVLIALAVPLVVFIGLVVLIASSLSHLSFGEQHRTYLKPIPIAASACPYVSLMHGAANNLQSAEPILGMAFDARGKPLTWPQTRARLDPALRLMELSVVVSESKFPTQVREQLSVVLTDVRQGRRQLALATDGTDFTTRTMTLLGHGQLAFGHAGDLVGKRCAVPLRADTNTMPFPFMVTTSSLPRSATSAG